MIFHHFLNGLFPKTCCLCNKDLKHEFKTNNKQLNRLCEKCRFELLQVSGLKRFYIKMPALLEQQKIGQCFYFWNFEDAVESLIKKYKYARYYRLADLFAEFAFFCLRNHNILEPDKLDTWGKLETWDFISPVPSAPSSIRQKRFNHTQMLTNAISKKLGLPVCSSALTATRERKNQSELKKTARIRNIRGAFAASKEQVTKKKILLVDDITTTGATIAESCKTLYRAGAWQVDVLTLAKRELYEI